MAVAVGCGMIQAVPLQRHECHIVSRSKAPAVAAAAVGCLMIQAVLLDYGAIRFACGSKGLSGSASGGWS